MKLRQIRARAYCRMAKVIGLPRWMRGTELMRWYSIDCRAVSNVV